MVPCINLQSTVRLEIFEVIIVRNLCRDHKKHIVTQKMFSLFVIATTSNKSPLLLQIAKVSPKLRCGTRWRTKKV